MEAEDVCQTLLSMGSSIAEILKEAKSYLREGSVDLFVNEHIGCLGRLVITSYGRELKSLGIKKREQLDDFCKDNDSNIQIHDAFSKLSESEDEFGSSVRFVVASYEGVEATQRWKAETGSTFQLVVDPNRVLYQYLGLSRTVYKSWCMATTNSNAEKTIEGNQSLKIGADRHQMGGDFVFSTTGHFKLVHCSVNPMDHPTAKELLEICRK